MGITGTEVAKEASDMIILDDNFATIVNAVKEGRGIYDNITKFVNYLLSSNIAELLVIFFGTFLGFVDQKGLSYISLLPIHLLWINLVTDGFPAIALSVDPIDPHIMDQFPRKATKPILSFSSTVQLIAISFIIAFGTLVACHVGLQESAKLGHTMAFTTLVVLEFVRIQMIRTQYHIGFMSNKWLFVALLGSLLLHIFVIYVPLLQNIFRTTSLNLFSWSIIALVAFVVWIASQGIYRISKYLGLIELTH